MTRSVSSPHWLLCREYLLVDFEAIEVGPRTSCRGSWICALGIAMDGNCEVLGWLPTNIDECMQSAVPSRIRAALIRRGPTAQDADDLVLGETAWRREARSDNEVVRREQQSPWLSTEGFRQTVNVGKRDVPARTFHRRHIGPVKVAFQAQVFLRPLLLNAEQADVVGQYCTNVVGRRQFGWWLRLRWHASSVAI